MLQRIALAIPGYHSVSTKWFAQMMRLDRNMNDPLAVTIGVYTPMAMRVMVEELLKAPNWDRLLVVETDTIIPPDALVRHANHTEDIVGSMYFQHDPPFALNVHKILPEGGMVEYPAETVYSWLDNPATYEVDTVGLGCTSIARAVFEKWEPGCLTFDAEYDPQFADHPFSHGVVSHDTYFCREARRQGFRVFVDTSIRCDHLTENHVNVSHWAQLHPRPIVETEPAAESVSASGA